MAKKLREIIAESDGHDEWRLFKRSYADANESGHIQPVKVHKDKQHYVPGGGDGRYSDTWAVQHKPSGVMHSIYANRGEVRIRQHNKNLPRPDVTEKLKKHLEDSE